MTYKVYFRLQDFFSDVFRIISERRLQIAIFWQSLPILIKVLILISWSIMIPLILALTVLILPPLVFVISGLFLCLRWFSIVSTDNFNIGDMKVPTFYTTGNDGDGISSILLPIVGVVFGGIHCVGWFFNFPSSREAMLWRVSSAVLTVIAFLLPIFLAFMGLFEHLISDSHWNRNPLRFFIIKIIICTIILLVVQVYVVSRLILLVEAFISLRHLTPGMLALVKWSSFIPHI